MGDGYFWENDNIDINVVDKMVSKAIRALADETSDEAAWEKIFKYFNQKRGKGNVGYQAGEKVAIKIQYFFLNIINSFAKLLV